MGHSSKSRSSSQRLKENGGVRIHEQSEISEASLEREGSKEEKPRGKIPKKSKIGKRTTTRLTASPFLNFLRIFRKKHLEWPPQKVAVEGARAWSLMSAESKNKFRKMKNDTGKKSKEEVEKHSGRRRSGGKRRRRRSVTRKRRRKRQSGNKISPPKKKRKPLKTQKGKTRNYRTRRGGKKVSGRRT